MKREEVKQKLLQTFINKYGASKDTIGIIKANLD